MIITNPRPNRFTEEKDEDYHVRYARWAIGSYNLFYYQDFIARYLTNTAFYKGNQWIFEEDLDPFLMDESGDVRNRIRWIQNIIKPFVDFYRGSSIRMDMNAEIISMSRESKGRREDALDRILYWQRMAEAMKEAKSPQVAEMIKGQFGLRDTEHKTIETFENLYVDDLVEKMSKLFKYISDTRNDIQKYKAKLSMDIALSGLGVMKETDFNGEQVWRRLGPEKFIFDNTCQEDDFTDAEFMGEFNMASSSDIYEQNQHLDDTEKKMIETALMSGSIGMGLHNIASFYFNYAQRVPVYEMYWRDVNTTRHAAFYDRYGFPVLEEVTKERPLNEAIPVKELAQYVDDYAWISTLLNDGDREIKKNNKVIDSDQIRFCKFLPMEYTNAGKDIVLDYGVRPYQEKNRLSYKKPDFPYKCATYSFVLGEILSPIDSLISPQRFLNRTLSIAESHINNSRGSGTVIDKDSIDMQGGEEEIQSNMNKSKPIYVRAQRQVNNVIGTYDATIKQGTLSLFDIASRMKSIANDVFGGGESITGGGGAYRATGAVNAANLTQGVIMQEPFFHALERIFMQMYSSMVDRGKRIYLSNKRELSFIVGDRGVTTLQLTDDLLLEDFNAKVIRNADFYTEREAADQMLMIFRDKGMIDDKTFASLYHNATMNEVAYGLRKFTGLKVEAEKQQAENMQNQQAIAARQAVVAGEMEDENQNKELQFRKAINDDNNRTKIVSKAMEISARDNSKKSSK